MSKGIMLSLFDYSTVMAQPWAEAGYECWCVDIKHPKGIGVLNNGIVRVGLDLTRETTFDWHPARPVVFVAAFPPCDHLASSGARWWEEKGLQPLKESIELVDAALRLCRESGAPYFIENPIGRLASLWRKPDYCFDPCDYGDPYTKKTCLWVGGGFVMPPKNRVEPTEGSKMHRLPPSAHRKELRSMTPPGFARAVFEANAPQQAGRGQG